MISAALGTSRPSASKMGESALFQPSLAEHLNTSVIGLIVRSRFAIETLAEPEPVPICTPLGTLALSSAFAKSTFKRSA